MKKRTRERKEKARAEGLYLIDIALCGDNVDEADTVYGGTVEVAGMGGHREAWLAMALAQLATFGDRGVTNLPDQARKDMAAALRAVADLCEKEVSG